MKIKKLSRKLNHSNFHLASVIPHSVADEIEGRGGLSLTTPNFCQILTVETNIVRSLNDINFLTQPQPTQAVSINFLPRKHPKV